MENETNYTLEFADGTKIENLTMNGTAYVSKDEVKAEDIEKAGTDTVKVTDSTGNTRTMENVYLYRVDHEKDGYYIIMGEKTAEQVEKERLQAQIDFLLMMQGITDETEAE